jgi:hypothetical protein
MDPGFSETLPGLAPGPWSSKAQEVSVYQSPDPHGARETFPFRPHSNPKKEWKEPRMTIFMIWFPGFLPNRLCSDWRMWTQAAISVVGKDTEVLSRHISKVSGPLQPSASCSEHNGPGTKVWEWEVALLSAGLPGLAPPLGAFPTQKCLPGTIHGFSPHRCKPDGREWRPCRGLCPSRSFSQ